MAITTHEEFRFVDVNQAYCDLVGLPRETLIGRRSVDFAHLDEDARTLITAALRQSGHLLDTPLCIRRADGATRDIVASIQLEHWAGQVFAISLYQDLTRHQRAQAALHSSEARFRLFYENLPLPVLIYDRDALRILDANPAALRLYGYTQEEFTQLHIADLFPAAARDTLSQYTRPSTVTAPRELALRHVTKSGALIDVLIATYPMPLPIHPARMAILRDITDVTAVQAALRDREERLHVIADMTTDAVWEHDLTRHVVHYTGGIHSQFGHPPGPRPAPDWWLEHVHPDDRARLSDQLAEALAENSDQWTGQYRFRKADGHYAQVIDRGRVLRDESGQATRILGALVDITHPLEVKAATARATQAERQELTQNLDQVVAQSLYSVSLMAEAARRRVQNGDMPATTAYIERLGDLARQSLKEMRLLVFQLRPTLLEQVGLVDTLQIRLDAVERRAGVAAHVHADLNRALPPALQLALYELAQAVLNNILRHASATVIEIALANDGEHVHLALRDNGRGVDPRGIDNWIEQSLADLRERVHNLGGVLTIDSRPGGGTAVQITLALRDGDNG